MQNYEHRFSQALKRHHAQVFDPATQTIKVGVAEELGKCPVCESPDYEIFCIKDNFLHKSCRGCSFIYVDPRLNTKATTDFYNSEVNEVYNELKFHSNVGNEPDDLENLENYEILKEHLKGNTNCKNLLEIGPGKGTFLKKAVSEGLSVYAVELNSLLIENLSKITSNIYDKDILELDLPPDYFDVIYFRDVMEHIPNVSAFLSRIRFLLKPGGIVFIDTHNIDSLVNRITKEYHTVIFAFEHPVHWSPKTLTLACKRANLSLAKVHFVHKHQSIQRCIDYFLNPSFTYINPPRRSRISTFILKGLSSLFKVRYVSSLDNRIMTFLSRVLKRGSKMQLIFTK